MKIEYDQKHDLMNIEFLAGAPITDSVEVDGIVIDYTEGGRIVSIEILDASKRTDRDPFTHFDFSLVKEDAVPA